VTEVRRGGGAAGTGHVTLPVSDVDVVYDLEAACVQLIARGAGVSEVFHLAGGPVPGPDPEGRSYFSCASFNDPDGNRWLFQEIKTRLPGR
jgi:hypothetical protein